MKINNRLLLIAVLFALALPLIFAGTTSAKYNGDGSVPDGTTGGWITPNDMVCIVGVHADGTLDIASGVTNSRDCIYYNTGLKTMDPVDVTSQSICAATAAGPFTSSCNSSANCKFTSGTSAATWNSTDSKCYDSAPCTKIGASGNDGAKHALATSICVDGSGNGLSLAGLDRTYSMCVAKPGGVWKQTSATPPYTGAPGTFPTPGYGGSCVAYNRQFKGQDSTGTALAFGTKGTVAAAGTGFCYTKINVNATEPANANACPSILGSSQGTKNATSTAAFGYTAGSSAPYCTYDYGVNGKVAADTFKADGTKYAKNAVVNFGSFTTMGDCLFNGGSWANWILSGSGTGFGAITDPIGGSATIMKFDLTRQSVNADDGCLHCHSSKTEYNGPAEREKDSYLKTGHKNMLRKVTAGQKWAGPDGVTYDVTGSAYGQVGNTGGSINFGTLGNNDATANGKPLLYIFGDWMAAAPTGLDVVVNSSGVLAKYNGTSNYSCSACHTAGWSNPGPGTCSDLTATSLGSLDQATCEAAGKVWTDAGLCSLSSNKSQSACTTAGGTWYPSIGVQAIGTTGYHGTQPADAFPGITFQGAGTWDNEGITCGRCHNAAWPQVSAAQIAASIYKTTDPVGQNGMGTLNAGVQRTKLCFGCHQSMPATSNGIGADVDLTNPTGLIVKNNATSPAYTPGFSGHVLGNSFLNSPHARFTGTVIPNSLGKYDLFTNTAVPNAACTAAGIPYACCTGAGTGSGTGSCASNYNSTFRGYTCWQTPTSTSPAKTKADGTEIKTKTECEGLYGAGAWRNDTGTPGSADSIQGTCTTCHDVHNSLFVVGQEGIRKECANCHADATYAADMNTATGATPFQATTINHPTSAGTPAAEDPSDPCIVCHMPKPTSGDFPMHVWRINSDATYSTFPTAAQFGIGATATRKNATTATDSKGYTNAVWVDVDLACGQCHNGAVVEAPTLTKTQLAVAAKTMHSGVTDVSAMTNAQCLTCHTSIVPGTNHHGVSLNCTTCHGTVANPLHNGTVPDKTSNTWCRTCHTTSGSNSAHHAVANLTINNVLTTCSSCHTTPGVLSTDQAAIKAGTASQTTLNNGCLGCHSSAQGSKHAIVTATLNGVGDNHHNGSGQSFKNSSNVTVAQNLSDPKWSRTNVGCAYCHSLGKAFGDSSTEVVQDQRVTGSCNGACHTSTLPASSGLTGSGQHHDGHGLTSVSYGGSSFYCLVCHVPGQPGAPGVTKDAAGNGNAPGQTPGQLPSWDNCTACHGSTPMTGTVNVIQSGVTQNHHTGACVECHAYAGVAANNSSATDNTACQACHSTSKTKAAGGTTMAINPNHGPDDNHHGEYATCVTCHGTKGGVAYTAGNTGCLSCHQDHPTAGSLVQGVNHHTGTCTVCHNPAMPLASQVPTTGVSGPGVLSSSFGVTVDCMVCHPTAVADHAIGAGHTIAHAIQTAATAKCQICHVNAGIRPTSATMAACTGCHDSKTITGGVAKTLPHHGVGSTFNNTLDKTPTVCTSCHTPGIDVTVQDTCGKCHSGSGPGMLFTTDQMTAASLPTVHSSSPIGENLNCSACHTDTMGSMHLSSTPGTPTTCIQCHNVTLHMKQPFDYNSACVNCHTNGPGPTLTVAQMQARAHDLHQDMPTAIFTSVPGDMQISVNAGSSVCPTGKTCTYNWTFGDNGTGTGITTFHVYAAAGTYNVTLQVLTNLGTADSVTHAVTVAAANHAPIIGKGAVSTTGLTVSFKDTSTDDNIGGAGTVYVNWGDGSALTTGALGATFTKTYASANTYNIDHYVKDAGGLYSAHDKFTATVPTKYKVTVNASGSLAGALVQIKLGAVTKAQGNTSTSGVYTSLGLDPGNYTMTISKYGYTFDCDAGTAGNQSTSLPADLTVGNASFTCTHTP